MSQLQQTPFALIPDTAPFDVEQRAWLNGFLAGWVGLQNAGGPASAAATAAVQGLVAGASGEAAANAEEAEGEEDFPWHDDALPMEERMELAEGRPLKRKLMAAMAQLNCGSCGYLCQTYAEAIADGSEKSLKKCTPGGKETARKLKELVAEVPPNVAADAPAAVPADSGSTWTRDNPFPATLLAVRNLNGEGSAKYTSHVEIDLSGSDLAYEVGDSLGLYPTNCGELVDEVLAELGADPIAVVTPPVGDPCSLRQALIGRVCLTEVTDELLEALIPRCADPADAELLKLALDDPDAIEGWDVLDVLRAVRSAKIGFDPFLQTLSPLQPRLYSISSSPKAHPGQVHLTVGRVEWERGARKRKGVASTMLADRLRVGETVRVFVQKSHGFTVPPDPQAPAIMIGPGTGIAPFRAFLEERAVTNAPGRNWLFFGDQRGETDFLYRDEFDALRDRGVLHRLDTAFSRDQEAKIYVQNRMLEAADELYDWLSEGAYLYVCGDAKRMAVDVDRALHSIVADRAGGEAAAKAFVQDLKKSKRYCRDVY
ncbi:sulfite reductase subunit alpha [Alienimonas californiensis]|uniref:assimilatory sulfite reductase (NADPH) n=1 Tax=Alienimonas californiensis TaxID=2527989 RepID=A0A517PE26_9PLAN|nr:sulfite reductase subunit alpha [Alienimonas californiensis]QDT17601.1 Sulfite reductase [NADPH] flavoprotein alpha-component [Alienimonas californiensis]